MDQHGAQLAQDMVDIGNLLESIDAPAGGWPAELGPALTRLREAGQGAIDRGADELLRSLGVMPLEKIKVDLEAHARIQEGSVVTLTIPQDVMEHGRGQLDVQLRDIRDQLVAATGHARFVMLVLPAEHMAVAVRHGDRANALANAIGQLRTCAMEHHPGERHDAMRRYTPILVVLENMLADQTRADATTGYPERPAEWLRVGQLRAAMNGLADDAPISVEFPPVQDRLQGAAPALYAYEQASDVGGPVGTDPMTESTMGVLVIGCDENDPMAGRDRT